jgi:hypothetical protein
MKFTEWFNPHSLQHIEAYKYLCDNGMWPKGFIPDDVKMDNGWWTTINFAMAELWVKQVLNGNVFGIPASDIYQGE